VNNNHEVIKKHIFSLYKRYDTELLDLRKKQREFINIIDNISKPQFDDLESEILYLISRHYKPEKAIEIGSLGCWSTSWMLNAMKLNKSGMCISHDIIDSSCEHLGELSEFRTFNRGDVRKTLDLDTIFDTNFLFIDAEHTTSFHDWCIQNLLDPLHNGINKMWWEGEGIQKADGIVPVIIHDVFLEKNNSEPHPESKIIIDWLENNNINYFSPSHAFSTFDEINKFRKDLSIGLNGNIHPRSEKNSMILFFLGGTIDE